MSNVRKRGTPRRSATQPSFSELREKEARERKKKIQLSIIIVASVISLILIIVFVSIYIATAPYRLIVVIVDDSTVRMDYFIDRVRLSGSDAMSMLTTITNEEIVKIEAPKYSITVRPEDIDQTLRLNAQGGSDEISDSEYREWYRQQLNETKLSDSEFRELTGTSLLIARFHNLLAENVPTVAEHVYVYTIVVETEKEANEVITRWQSGEDFSDLARELSIDDTTRESGGDLGWIPPGILYPGYEYIVFNLATGNITQPLITQEGYYVLFTVTDRVDTREMDEDYLEIVKGDALDNWLAEEIKYHEVSYHGFNNGFDSETSAWIRWQITRQYD